MTKLIGRWRDDAAKAMVSTIFRRLLAGESVDDLELDRYNGRVDLRYLPAPAPEVIREFDIEGIRAASMGNLLRFHDVTLEQLDLTGARLPSIRFHSCAIKDCIFDSADCRDWRLWNTEVERSSFRRTNFREAAVGTWEGGSRNEWRGVDFAGSDFRVTNPLGALFDNCNFGSAKLKGVEFLQCSVVRCRFAGELADVTFDGRRFEDSAIPTPLKEVDFTNAHFTNVVFRGCEFDHVELPEDPDLRLVSNFPCVATHILKSIATDGRVEARQIAGVIQNRIRGPIRPQSSDVFNRRDYQERGPEFLGILESFLNEAEAECS